MVLVDHYKKDNNVDRNPNTVNGWLKNSLTIAPMYPEETFKAILEMTETSDTSVSELIKSRDEVMKSRKQAYPKLLKYIPKTLENEELQNFKQFPIRLPNAEIVFTLIHIEEFQCELEVDFKNLWQVVKM